MTTFQTVAEIAMGVLFAAGAIFNAAYTLGHGDKFYGSFADGAWLGLARRFIRSVVIPSATAFTVCLIAFEAVVAVAIFTRGDLVRPALVAGALFATVAALASSPGGAAGNLILAALQAGLALARG